MFDAAKNKRRPLIHKAIHAFAWYNILHQFTHVSLVAQAIRHGAHIVYYQLILPTNAWRPDISPLRYRSYFSTIGRDLIETQDRTLTTTQRPQSGMNNASLATYIHARYQTTCTTCRRYRGQAGSRNRLSNEKEVSFPRDPLSESGKRRIRNDCFI